MTRPTPSSALLHALREAVALCAGEADPVLQQLGREMDRLFGHLVEQIGQFGEFGPAGHEREACGLSERLLHLRRVIEAEAGLVHAEPARARAARLLLTLLGAQDASTSLSSLAAARALLFSVAADHLAAIEALGLGPVLRQLEASVERVQALLDRQQLPTAPGAPLFTEAAGLLLRYRAYVIVLTGKLGPAGEDQDRRRRLLGPLDSLPLYPPVSRPAQGPFSPATV